MSSVFIGSMVGDTVAVFAIFVVGYCVIVNALKQIMRL